MRLIFNISHEDTNEKTFFLGQACGPSVKSDAQDMRTNVRPTEKKKPRAVINGDFFFFSSPSPTPQKFAEMQKSVLYSTGFKLFKSYTFTLFNLMSLQ